MKELPLSKVYQFIEPGPVVLLTTQAPGTKPNAMTMSWHMMLEFEPPLIACVVAERNYSFEALHKTHECVIAVPPASLARIVTGIGNCTGRDTDKFGSFELTPLPASHVAAPLVGEAMVNLECRVKDTKMVKTYNLFVLECVKAWKNPKLQNTPMLHHHGYGIFTADGERIKMESKMR